MWRILAAMRRNMRKSPRVADENMFGGDGNGAGEPPAFGNNMERRGRRGWDGVSVIYSILKAPFSILSCFANPHINGADGVWASGELARMSEINHLMVNDSMRYAILM